jgi:CCR4-NOT transcription complex subunit 7/8
MFAEHLMTSSLLLNPEVHWIIFHGGVDFGYILKMLLSVPLPAEETVFFEMMDAYFCNYFDLKEIKRDISHLAQGGLSKLAKDLDVERIGTVH